MPHNTSTILSYRKGVGLMIINKKKQVFIGKRLDGGKINAEDTWQMPQGGIDEGESIEQAAFRELHEETGIKSAAILCESKEWLQYDIPLPFRKQFWNGQYNGQEQKWLLLEFLGDDSEIDIENNGHPEFKEWRWAGIDELPDLVVDFKKQLYLAVMTEFEPIIKKSLKIEN